jgi:hypothetical protein
VEATKPPKPSVQRVASGDSASMQAVTKVNAEQASKTTTQELTRRKYGEGRSRWETTSELSQRSCRGIGDGMQTQGLDATREAPAVIAVVGQPVARESQAGPFGVAERLVSKAELPRWQPMQEPGELRPGATPCCGESSTKPSHEASISSCSTSAVVPRPLQRHSALHQTRPNDQRRTGPPIRATDRNPG